MSARKWMSVRMPSSTHAGIYAHPKETGRGLGEAIGYMLRDEDGCLAAAAPEMLEALYITSNCSPVTKDLAAMPDDAEVTLTFTAADLKQIRAAIAHATGFTAENLLSELKAAIAAKEKP